MTNTEEKDTTISHDFKCDQDKCFLAILYPNSDSSLACDDTCYFSEEGKESLRYYIERFPEQWEKVKSK